jgi:zinc metalloprotease ZmpB
MAFSITPNVQVETDASGVVRHLQHPQEPYLAGPDVGSEAELATIYLRDVAEVYGIDRAMLTSLGEEPPEGPGPYLELAEQKPMMGTTIVSFVETYNGLPVWEAGFTVSIQANPLRVTGSWSTVHLEVDLDEPSELGPGLTPEEATTERVAELLGLKRERPAGRPTRRARDEARLVRVNESRALIYRYDPDLRIDPESRIEDDRPLSSGPPTLALPEVPDRIQAGRHYLVTEVLLTLELPVLGELHWRGFFERYTGAVLYLRAFVASADGLVFRADPMTLAGGPLPNGPLAQLDALRSLMTLADLQTQVGGVPVALNGRFVQLVELSAPPAAPPTEPFGHFLYNVNTTNFSAVNAYHHLDS